MNSHNMKPTKEQRKNAYSNLSDEAQFFIMSNETTDLISTALQESGFSEEQADQADSEILYAMYGLQSLDDAMKNIASLSQKPVESLAPLKSKLKENIFDKLEEIKKTSEPRKESSSTNLPMVEAGEVAHEVPHVEMPNQEAGIKNQGVDQEASMEKAEAAPTAQPTEPLKPEAKPPANHYPGGKDPYREPIE